MKVFLFLVAAVACVSSIEVCAPNFCDQLPDCSPKCAPGEALTHNDNCDCCGYCERIQIIAEHCHEPVLPKVFTSPFRDDPAGGYVCERGYRCDPITRKCVVDKTKSQEAEDQETKNQEEPKTKRPKLLLKLIK